MQKYNFFFFFFGDPDCSYDSSCLFICTFLQRALLVEGARDLFIQLQLYKYLLTHYYYQYRKSTAIFVYSFVYGLRSNF